MDNKGLLKYIKQLLSQFDTISEDRKVILEDLARKVNTHKIKYGQADIIVICTHNSRRSQLGEAWISTACQYFGIQGVSSYSGGTSATAFNIRMIVAMRQVSFHLQTEQPADNPRYMFTGLQHTDKPHYMYSKTYDDPYNPQNDFIAVLVCNDADESCPVVRGAAARISLPYRDPKEYDDTPMEHEAYTQKVEEIGKEFLYMISKVNNQ